MRPEVLGFIVAIVFALVITAIVYYRNEMLEDTRVEMDRWHRIIE
jgi:hypothetical protein